MSHRVIITNLYKYCNITGLIEILKGDVKMTKIKVAFSFVAALMIIIFLGTINYLTTPNDYWSFYPICAILYWPVTVYYISKKRYKMFSIVGAFISIALLAINNYINYPEHPWFLYATMPILWWPITQCVGKWRETFSFSLVSSSCLIAYYILLNYYISPAYPWSIYTTFTFLWWPIIMYFGRKKKMFALSIIGTMLFSIFFIIVNIISSPQVIWAIYPIFAVLWWPLVTYFFFYLKKDLLNE